MKPQNNFILRQEYNDWLQNKEKIKTEKARNCYFLQDKINNNGPLYLDVIPCFLYYNEPIYAYTILDKWCNDNKIDKNRSCYLKKYRQFIHSLRDVKSIIDNNEFYSLIAEEDLDIIRKSFNKGALSQLDGMDSLVDEITESRIIELAIESSFFFDKEIVTDRFSKIRNAIVKQGCLPARSSQKNDQSQTKKEGSQVIDPNSGNLIYKDENDIKICDIEIDGNGNAKVCQIINQYTGYNLAYELDKKPFKNYIISHIWGRAIDPRYFTNLWNIVLVPAWANHLLDKDADEDSLSARLKATFMQICIKYYQLNRINKKRLSSLKMSEAPKCKGKPQKGTYNIHKIQKVEKYKSQIGKIMIEPIEIK